MPETRHNSEGLAHSHYTTADGDLLIEIGTPMVRRPGTVFLVRLTEGATVETGDKTHDVGAGDFVAYDPINGRVWPLAASHVDEFYVGDADVIEKELLEVFLDLGVEAYAHEWREPQIENPTDEEIFNTSMTDKEKRERNYGRLEGLLYAMGYDPNNLTVARELHRRIDFVRDAWDAEEAGALESFVEHYGDDFFEGGFGQ